MGGRKGEEVRAVNELKREQEKREGVRGGEGSQRTEEPEIKTK